MELVYPISWAIGQVGELYAPFAASWKQKASVASVYPGGT
jgi:hypothetical protein